MVSRIDLGPDGGPYVEIDENAGDLVIRVPNDTVDFDSNDLLNAVLQNATMDGGSLDGVSLASALDANNQDLNSVGTASVASLEAELVSTESLSSELTTPTELSDSRSFGTEFQNTSGHLLIVFVTVEDEDGTNGINAQFRVGNESSLSTSELVVNEIVTTDTIGDRYVTTLGPVIVPDGAYYEVTQSGGITGFDLRFWTEVEFA